MATILYQLGKLTFRCPGPMNAEETSEEFGHDFAVKEVVGAMRRRESMGPADHKFTLTGTLLPYFHTRVGVGSGMSEIDTLQAMAAAGKPHLLVRGDGTRMGNAWLIERGGLRSSKLSSKGIGNVIKYDISLVETPDTPTAADMMDDLNSLLSSLTQVVGTAVNAIGDALGIPVQLFQ